MISKKDRIIQYLFKINPDNYSSASFHIHTVFNIGESEVKEIYSEWVMIKQKPICSNCEE